MEIIKVRNVCFYLSILYSLPSSGIALRNQTSVLSEKQHLLLTSMIMRQQKGKEAPEVRFPAINQLSPGIKTLMIPDKELNVTGAFLFSVHIKRKELLYTQYLE